MKWPPVSLGASVFEARTIFTVYAGLQILPGEIIWISGMWPPWGMESLMRASDTSQLEYSDNPDVVLVVVDAIRANSAPPLRVRRWRRIRVGSVIEEGEEGMEIR
jgi:hypothetical protein